MEVSLRSFVGKQDSKIGVEAQKKRYLGLFFGEESKNLFINKDEFYEKKYRSANKNKGIIA